MKLFWRTFKKSHTKGQPVLVGTASIEKSELLSSLLKKAKLKHNVLNARYHEQEAHIIAQAGVPGAITIATNMAGRGTDIQLGGNVDMRLQESLKGGETEEEKAVQKSVLRMKWTSLKLRLLRPGGFMFLGQNGMKVAVLIISYGAVRVVRVIRENLNSIFPFRTI